MECRHSESGRQWSEKGNLAGEDIRSRSELTKDPGRLGTGTGVSDVHVRTNRALWGGN